MSCPIALCVCVCASRLSVCVWGGCAVAGGGGAPRRGRRQQARRAAAARPAARGERVGAPPAPSLPACHLHTHTRKHAALHCRCCCDAAGSARALRSPPRTQAAPTYVSLFPPALAQAARCRPPPPPLLPSPPKHTPPAAGEPASELRGCGCGPPGPRAAQGVAAALKGDRQELTRESAAGMAAPAPPASATSSAQGDSPLPPGLLDLPEEV